MKIFHNVIALLLLLISVGAHGVNYSFLKDAPANNLTDADMEIFETAVWSALDNSPDGEISAWRNTDTGASGKLKPLKTYQDQGMTCRRLQIANKAGGAKGNFAFNFCKQPDDSWKVVN